MDSSNFKDLLSPDDVDALDITEEDFMVDDAQLLSSEDIEALNEDPDTLLFSEPGESALKPGDDISALDLEDSLEVVKMDLDSHQFIIDAEEQSYGKVTNLLLLAHLFSQQAMHMWEFLVPLVLVQVFGNSLGPAAAFSLFHLLLPALIGNWLARKISEKPPLQGIGYMILGQILFVIGGGAIMCLLIYHSFRHETVYSWAAFTHIAGYLLLFLIGIGGLCKLFSVLALSLVERKWMPLIYTEIELSDVLSKQRSIDLVAQFTFFLLQAGLMTALGISTKLVVIVSAAVVAACVGQFIALRAVHSHRPELQPMLKTFEAKKEEIVDDTSINSIQKSLSLMSEHRKLSLIVLSCLLVHLTLLDSNSMIFISFLKDTQELTFMQLGGYKAGCAAAGLIGWFVYRLAESRLGLFPSTLILSSLYAVAIVIGVVLLHLMHKLDWYLLPIAVAYIGYYGYVNGKAGIYEGSCSPHVLPDMLAVDRRTSFLAGVLINAGVFLAPDPIYFKKFAIASAGSVCLGVLVIIIFSSFPQNRMYALVGGSIRGSQSVN